MKKNYLLIAAAAAMFAACSDTDTFKGSIENNETEIIGFQTYHGKSTRAAVNNPEDLTSINGGFGVYGFKHLNQRTAASGIINLSDVSNTNVNYVTTVFDNVKVWYDDSTPTDFTYAIPKYWDKLKFYTFFAYAPYAEKAKDAVEAQGTEGQEGYVPAADAVKGIAFNQNTGLFTRNDVKSLQSTNNTTTTGTNNRPQYTTADETGGVIDYLIAPYVPNQKNATDGTNQSEKGYSEKDQTVGFTFYHTMSKFNIKVQAKDEENGHQYKGVKDIIVTKLNIENLPNISTDITYTQTSVESNSGNVPSATFTPSSYATQLNIIADDQINNTVTATDKSNALTTNALYILDGGSNSGTLISPADYIPQEFHYFIAPNTPTEIAANDGHDKYVLNIDYQITYVDGTIDPFTRSIDLSNSNNVNTGTNVLTTMEQNNIYNITVTIGLNQIYLTVDDVVEWADPKATGIDIE